MAELAAWAIAHPPLIASDRLGLHKETSPSWSDPDLISADQRENLRGALQAGESIAVRVPIRIRSKQQGATEVLSFFDVFIRRDAAALGTTVQFVRGGLLVSGMGKRIHGIRALVVAEDAGVAGFLRAAENPSHTKWNSKAIKDGFTYAPGTLNFVVESAKYLSTMLSDDPAEKDGTIWAGAMSLSTGNDFVPGTGAGKGASTKRRRVKTTQVREPLGPIVKKRPYEIKVIPGGFVVCPSGRPFPSDLPVRLELKLAYHVRGKDPLAKFSIEDFDLTEESDFPSVSVGCAVEVREPNRLVINIENTEFSFETTGFDVRREVFCRPRLERTSTLPADEVEGDGEGTDDIEFAVDSIVQGATE
jgi:hypothetical protein